MSENSKIEWTDHTFNPWIGCSKVSEGCRNCYAETLDRNRFSKTLGGATKERPISHWGPGAPRQRTSAANWQGPLKWNAKYVKENPEPHSGLPLCPRVFCASLADWLDPEVPIEWLADLLDLIRRTPHLNWQLLTKRPELWERRIAEAYAFSAFSKPHHALMPWLTDWIPCGDATPPHNVWIGTSIENQKAADERIPALLEIPARVRFLSSEPLLGPVNLVSRRDAGGVIVGTEWLDHIHWVIVGGESGPGFRPFDLKWARWLQIQSYAARVAFFMKQLGGATDKRGRLEDLPEDLRIREFPVEGRGA